MDTTYCLFASISEEVLDYNSCIRYEALDIEYKTECVLIKADEESEAVRIFQGSDIYVQFCFRHEGCVYTFVKADGDASFHRADLNPSATV